MRNINCILLICLLIGCKRENKENYENTYIKGVITIRAEEKYPIGLIKVINFSKDDDLYEEPLRGIVYHYDHVSKIKFDLNDTVSFKIKNLNKYQVADDVMKDTLRLSPLHARVNASNTLMMNLHLADEHREGPFHNKVHVRTGMYDGAPDTNIDGGMYGTLKYVRAALTSDPNRTYNIYLVRQFQYPTIFYNYYYMTPHVNNGNTVVIGGYTVVELLTEENHVH